jgi:hypothetical protein
MFIEIVENVVFLLFIGFVNSRIYGFMLCNISAVDYLCEQEICIHNKVTSAAVTDEKSLTCLEALCDRNWNKPFIITRYVTMFAFISKTAASLASVCFGHP